MSLKVGATVIAKDPLIGSGGEVCPPGPVGTDAAPLPEQESSVSNAQAATNRAKVTDVGRSLFMALPVGLAVRAA